MEITEIMTVRTATEQDIAKVVEMGREFLMSGPYKGQLEDNPTAATIFAYSILRNMNGRILVSEGEHGVNGVFAFIVAPHFLSGEMTAMELIWYVEPAARAGGISLKLLAEAENMARELGVKRMQLTAPSEEVGNLYRYCGGYKKMEVTYQRTL
jgi:N-acetylglutamate synthase-like GNAT family acetyltransferase